MSVGFSLNITRQDLTMFRHIASGKLYKVVLVCRRAGAMSNNKQVVYAQVEASTDRFTGEPIRSGTLWARPKEEFDVKFEPHYSSPKNERS